MPDLDTIEDFKLLVNSLGKEPSIVAKEGGSIEDVPAISPDGDSLSFTPGDDSADFDLNGRLEEALSSEEESGELVPDLGGFDFGEDSDNPFGDLNDFTLEDDFHDDMSELADAFDEEESVEDIDYGETEDELDEFSFSDEEAPDFADELPPEVSEPEEEGLPETLGDLFENGSEEAIPDFIAPEPEEEDISFDDFTLDMPSEDFSQPADLDDAEDLEPLEEVDEIEPETEEPEEELPVLEDEFDLSDEPEISLEDDFDLVSDISEIEEVEEIGEEPEEDTMSSFSFDSAGEMEDFDMSPGDFGDLGGDEDYSFGEELAAIDEMREETPEVSEFEISEEQFRSLKITLSTLPRNLKLAVEEIIAEQKLKGPKYEGLVMLLVEGGSPREVADYILKTINRKIKLPSGYMKKSGLALERSKSGFAYIFSRHTWPILRWVLLGMVALWIAGMLSLLFLYRPIHAGQLYSGGYEKIYADQYETANSMFESAWNGWPLGPFFIDGWRNKNWFYKYAEAYRDRRQFIEAARKYDELLTFYPDDIQGLMDYARMETYETAEYEHAEEILRHVLSIKVNDYTAMLAYGDNYFEWSDEDPVRLEDARFVYATVLDAVGGKDEVLLRMLRYFLKKKDDENIERLKKTFQTSDRNAADPPYFSKVYSELGGYLLDKGEPAEALTVLLRAQQEYAEIPDVHYQLARYFRGNEDDRMEELALRKVLFYLDQQTPLKKDKIFMKLDTHRRRGELKNRKREYLEAENEFRQGIALYENSIIRNLIGASSTGGKLYADLGALYYRNNDFMAALNMFDKAEKNRFITPEIEYQRGVCTYVTGDYERALVEFYNAGQGMPGNRNILYALGNTMLKRENYYGAQSAYTRVIEGLEEEEKNIGYLQIEEKDEHRSLVQMYSKTYNNLAVAYYNLARSSTDVDKISLAMVCLTKASEYSDLLTRDPETKVRANPPAYFESAEEYQDRNKGNLLDGSGYRVIPDYEIHFNVDDILF